MENNNEKETFNYAYSAKQQKEIMNIRKKYALNDEEDKMERLRRLDRSVTQKGSIVSIVVGIIGALVLGVGMSCALVWSDMLFIPGIIIGIAGIGIVSLAYPLYSRITKKERERLAPEIIRLTDELMK
ncbi:MAG: hypothetical protein IJ391_02995 [Clostridia bacterium]|nr:hypothetical protein [Clostridia bacterium]